MRANKNEAHVEGYIYQIDLEMKTTGPNAKTPNVNYIQGRVDVVVDEEGLNVIPVHFTYVTPTYPKSGKKNMNYPVLERLMQGGEDITWVKVGNQAMKVSIDGALELNDFVSRDGSMVSQKRIRGSFCSVLTQPLAPVEKRSTFRIDTVLTRFRRIEADPERNIPNEYLVLGGATFAFNNDLLPIEVEIENPMGISYFESMLDGATEPLYTRLDGTIINKTVLFEKTEESAFGDPIVTTTQRSERKWLVTNCLKEAYAFGEEGVLTMDELTEANQKRELHLAEVKRQNEEYKARQANGGAAAPQAQTAAPSVSSAFAQFAGQKPMF